MDDDQELFKWRPGYEPTTRDDARELIAHRRTLNGGLSDEVRQNTPPEALAAIASLRAQVSSSATKYELAPFIRYRKTDPVAKTLC